jgi:hypothetical protein
MSNRPKTKNLGAQRERDCIRAKIRRVMRKVQPKRNGEFQSNDDRIRHELLMDMLHWINGRADRFRAKEGGL